MTVGRIPNIEGGIQPTLLTTTGDIMYASAANTPARLGIGSSAQVLTVASGVPSWATPAGGKVLQVVAATSTTQTTTTSTTLADTGLTATITPTLNTSKVLVMVSQPILMTRQSDQAGGGMALLRNSTDIYNMVGSNAYSTMYSRIIGGNTNCEYGTVIPMVYLDSPATTSATTYKTQHRVYQATSSANSTAQPDSAAASIILLEIGA